MKKINLKDKNTLLILGGALLGIILIVVLIIVNSNKVKIRTSEAQSIELVKYEHEKFTMQIPKGWKVETAGENMYFSIRVYNPSDDRYQIFSILKAEPLLKNTKAKTWYQSYYNLFGGAGNKMLAEAIVLDKGTAEAFYSNFNAYVNFAKTLGSTFNAPDLKDFAVVETYNNNSPLSSFAIDDKILRGTFRDSKTSKNGEGLFMATIINQGTNMTLGYDTLFYTAYNVMGITTGEYDLVNYEKILTASLNSLEYKDSFIEATNRNSTETTKQALSLNASIQQAYDSYNKAWSNRQTTYDITSQKYSDATLGYERVYDTKTGEVYKAYNGFTDDYDGKRYKPITDEMYTYSISGYIDK